MRVIFFFFLSFSLSQVFIIHEFSAGGNQSEGENGKSIVCLSAHAAPPLVREPSGQRGMEFDKNIHKIHCFWSHAVF